VVKVLGVESLKINSFESKLVFLFFVMSIESKSILNEILLSLLFLSIFFKLIAYATIDLYSIYGKRGSKY
jgi:hypothetical protein